MQRYERILKTIRICQNIYHTYRYRMSYSIGRTFEVPYWLTPAKRWANHQIDDFTLCISTTYSCTTNHIRVLFFL